MKILIVGKNSYIGTCIDNWLTSRGWDVYELDTLTEEWKYFDYTSIDAIVHVAGIVHRPDCNDWDLYKKVNVEMTYEIAYRAKIQGVNQYIYLSSMAVYGVEKQLTPTIINESTPLCAHTLYGRSKLLAEQALMTLQDENFNVSLIRPPSVYGKGCKGSYISGFTSVVKNLPVFPIAYRDVKQSMIYIDNLCQLIYLIIESNLKGVFCPQDEKAVSANEIIDAIGEGIGKNVKGSRLLGLAVRLFRFIPLIKKAYGGVEYSMSLSEIDGFDYRVVDFKDGMVRTVRNIK